MIRVIMKDKVNRVIHDTVVPDAFYDPMVGRWRDQIDELNVDRTYPDPRTHPDVVQLMNAARARATLAMREARIERNRRRRLKGISETEEALLGGDDGNSDLSSLSDPGSNMDEDDDESQSGEDDDGSNGEQSDAKSSSEGD